jgi:hypothetical protein
VFYIIHIRLENKNIFSSFFKILLQQFLYPTRFHKRSSLVLKFDSFVTQSGTLSLSTCEKCRYCSIFGHFKINFKSWFLKKLFFCCLIPERFEKKKFLNIFQTVDQIHFKYSKCLWLQLNAFWLGIFVAVLQFHFIFRVNMFFKAKFY